MNKLFIFFTIINFVTVISLFVYFSIAWLDLTFTFSDLNSDNIPFYNNATNNYNRYNVEWWIYASDMTRWLLPIFSYWTCWVLILDKGSSPFIVVTFYTVIIVFFGIIEVLKVFKYSWNWYYCKDYQFCRNFNSDGNPNDANYVFLTIWAYSVFFLIMVVVYGLMALMMNGEAEEMRRKLNYSQAPSIVYSISKSGDSPIPKEFTEAAIDMSNITITKTVDIPRPESHQKQKPKGKPQNKSHKT